MNSFHNFYYFVKPVLPKRFRYAMRRMRAHYKLASTHDWPILESASQKPPDWPGWPDGKQFAFVLTHDVEGKSGINRYEQLAETDLRLGFRSSFNFVPEGEYPANPILFDKLLRNGFEIGVHDLHHDGSLYHSQKGFIKAAQSINQYITDWGAVGFRAGFMFHNLDWLHALNIEYDASTFDTDPFEPQSDGARTIFPFWVQRLHNHRGFVELPYTLPQDSTIFLVLREKTIDIWKKKLDWLADKGGMALLNVHPDYLTFQNKKTALSEYPAAFYEEFLLYVKETYKDAYWNPLPRDLAAYVRQQH